MNARWLVLGMVFTASAIAGAKEPLSIRVTPAFAFAPATLVIRTSVEPHAENRSMEVVADSGSFYRSSAVQLEGDQSPRTTTFQFRSLPPGEYQVTVSVMGADGRPRAITRASVNVMESGAPR
jgi:hypothetical protein